MRGAERPLAEEARQHEMSQNPANAGAVSRRTPGGRRQLVSASHRKMRIP